MTLWRGLLGVSRETVLLPVHLWRLISRLLPSRCKYHPSCSAYALEAVRSRGVIVGFGLAAWRILRCNPWSLGGIDPVPPRRARGSSPEGAPGADSP
jgi:putative membrane protein insertion efficiency factor